MKAGDIVRFGSHEWRVLKVNDKKAMIILKDTLAQRAYHGIAGDITWEESDMRKFLNTEFYDSFNNDEQNRILTTEVISSDNAEYGTKGGNNTSDKIFLISLEETITLFKDDADRVATYNGSRMWWRLRTPGNTNAYTIYVSPDGGINGHGQIARMKKNPGGVRPVLWINLR